jgi:hypothetical protein
MIVIQSRMHEIKTIISSGLTQLNQIVRFSKPPID